MQPTISKHGQTLAQARVHTHTHKHARASLNKKHQANTRSPRNQMAKQSHRNKMQAHPSNKQHTQSSTSTTNNTSHAQSNIHRCDKLEEPININTMSKPTSLLNCLKCFMSSLNARAPILNVHRAANTKVVRWPFGRCMNGSNWP